MGRDSRGSYGEYDDERDARGGRPDSRSARDGRRSGADGYGGSRDDDTPRSRSRREGAASGDGRDYREGRDGPRSIPPRGSRGGPSTPADQPTLRGAPGTMGGGFIRAPQPLDDLDARASGARAPRGAPGPNSRPSPDDDTPRRSSRSATRSGDGADRDGRGSRAAASGYDDQPTGSRSDGRGGRSRSGRDPREGGDGRDGRDGREGAPARRNMAQMARDFSRTMSRQMSAMVAGARRVAQGGRGDPRYDGRADGRGAPSGRMSVAGASGRMRTAVAAAGALDGATPDESAARYRRSRIRMRARKWRLGRVRANPIGFAIGFGITVALLVSLMGGGAYGAYYSVAYYSQHISNIDALYNLQYAQSTVIYDRSGQVIYRANGANGGQSIYVPLRQISPTLQNATIAIEDHSFYSPSNIGINFTSTLRALTVDAGSGTAAQGGSTITQQLVKNAVLHDQSKALQRKINEAILAVGMTETGHYTKAQILEMYLNSNDYGDQNIGIEAAAENYFGLKPKTVNGQTVTGAMQLDLAESAMLAGVANAPSEFKPNQYTCDAGVATDPPNAPDGKPIDPKQKPYCADTQWASPCVAGSDPTNLGCPQNYNYYYLTMGHEWIVYRRAKEVLNAMVTYQGLSQSAENQALQEIHDLMLYHRVNSALFVAASNPNHTTNLAPNFVDFVFQQIVAEFPQWFPNGADPRLSGLKIYTSLDLNLQKYAQQQAIYYIDGDPTNHQYQLPWYTYSPHYVAGSPQTSLSAASNVNNAAVVAMDVHTGDVLAMVGSVNYTNTDPTVGGFNNVATSPRSLGSSTKPLVYTTAFQMGWNPAIMMQDAPICFPGKSYPATQANAFAQNCLGYYAPTNFEQNSFAGQTPLSLSLANSLNIPATEAMSFVGDSPSTSATFLAQVQRLGIHTYSAANMGPTTALGTQNVSLLDLTDAYATFANLGRRAPYRAILAVQDPTGREIYSASRTPPTSQVLSPQAAYMLTSILSNKQYRVADFNSPNPLEFDDPGVTAIPGSNDYGSDLNFPAVAAKTGTSQGINGPKDIVTMGYSPYMALGVWAGNTNGADVTGNIIGIAGAGYIFHDVMGYAITHYGWTPGVDFPQPQGMAYGEFNCSTGLAPYKGTDLTKPHFCIEQPAVGKVCGPGPVCATNMYAGFGGYPGYPNYAWYIAGQEWLES